MIPTSLFRESAAAASSLQCFFHDMHTVYVYVYMPSYMCMHIYMYVCA